MMPGVGQKKLEKTMEAEDVTLLRYLVDLCLRELQKEGGIDMVLFVGVDGRIFASQVPGDLTPQQYYLLNIFKSNLYHICNQLKSKNLRVIMEQYAQGSMIISSVGDYAFLASIISRELGYEDVQRVIKAVLKWSVIVNHVFQLKPMKGRTVEGYPEEIQKELKRLSRKLFVDHFSHTKQYRKNMEILQYLKKRISEVLGVGMADEVVVLTFNELGTTAPYMTDALWRRFVEIVIERHIRPMRGDVIADETYRTWMSELERKLRSFV